MKFSPNISDEDYQLLPNNWNLKIECLNYLEKDLLGLLEALNKASNLFFNNYMVDMSKYTTLPSLAQAIWDIN